MDQINNSTVQNNIINPNINIKILVLLLLLLLLNIILILINYNIKIIKFYNCIFIQYLICYIYIYMGGKNKDI